ncbi:MAG TPA: PQQ-dependent sugar dehydrogenase [Chthoniobacteraceae bacterium]|nr:PQQ-dependent sugar dehydrogenase [Chthoniobacteraceae bacterium]
MPARFVLFFLISLCLTLPLRAQEEVEVPARFLVDTVCDEIDAAVSMALARDGRVFVCEQTGAVRIVKNGALLAEPFVRLAVDDFWERGVVGVALHPRFPEEPFVYVHYVRKTPFIHHTVSRFTARGDVAVPESELVIIEAEDQSLKVGQYPGAHQGGAMRFGADDRLYVTIGEHNVRDPAQSLESLHGKILRFNPDGSIPEDNPFFQKAEGKHRAIYALGLRNPFGLAVDRASGRMFVNDVGQELFEEIDEVAAGANYGWPIAEGLMGNRPEFKKPLHIYGRKEGTCISGGVFYRAPEDARSRFPAEFEGKYFFADFMAGWIRVLDPEKPETSAPFAKRIPGPVDLAVESDGSLLVLVRNAWVHDDKLKRHSSSLVRIRAVR